jgi:glutathione peroxidase
MTEKLLVNGENCHPLYAFLRQNSSLQSNKGTGSIGWNFGKFLVNSTGKVIGYYEPTVSPNSILPDIKKLLV